MAAANPWGPAPTTTASRRPSPSPVTGVGPSPPAGQHADRRRERPPRRPDRGAVPDVAPVAPLAALGGAYRPGLGPPGPVPHRSVPDPHGRPPQHVALPPAHEPRREPAAQAPDAPPRRPR